MKKLMVVAAIAFAAVCAQAANVNWNIVNVQDSTGMASAGNLIQIFDASTVYSYDSAKAGTITALGTGTAFQSGTIMRAGGSIGGYSAGDPVALYAVVYDAATVADAKNYIVSAVPANKKIGDNGADLTLAYGNMAGTTSANMFYGKSWTATGGGDPTPEPTSGLLLLLGVAGLALKRKIA